DGDAVTLATGTAPVSGGALATFDPTLLLNGLYELELTATDVQGQQVSESIAVSVEGQMKIGHFTLSFVDLAIPVSGLDIEVIRTYDSRDKQLRDFGVGWSLDVRQGSYRNNRPPGDGWQLKTGFLPCDTVLESKSHLTIVRLSDREVYRFALRLQDGVPSTGGGCFANARFDFVDGPLPGTTLEILGQTQVFYENGSDGVIDVDTLDPYEPEGVRLTTRDGRIFELDLNDGVTLVEDLNGNRLSITPAGITHSSGKGIAFERDAQGWITGITDPLARTMAYSYDVAGNLVSFTNRAGAVTRFTYDDDHRLLDIEDPRGIKPVRNEYDADGRLVRHIDAFGKVIELGHDLGNRREVVTNRLGYSRGLEYDARGNVVREIDELGNITTRAYDGRDNLLIETNPLGHTTAYTYTAAGDLETLTDPLGNMTRYTYDNRGRLLTTTDPRGGVITSTYDSRGNLERITDALGKATALTYDAAGNTLSTTDVAGHVTSFGYDAFGNLTSETDTLGNRTDSTYDATGNHLTETRTRTLADGSVDALVTSFAYDDLDRVVGTTAADGGSTSVSYGLLGEVSSSTNALGWTTMMAYDLMGRLITVTYPDGTAETMSYDDEGQLASQVDRAGRTTSFLYDRAGRLLTTTFPDGSSNSRAYDDAGRLVAFTDARGNTTTYAYDAAGRYTRVNDPLGNGQSITYDEVGNQTAIVDARGHSTAFTYDARNRLATTTHPDATTTQLAYDDLARLIAETDPAGSSTEFDYDALGRLTRVTDALDQTTIYTYDEVGNRLSRTDANGHTTGFEYDRLGRRTARILPGGSRESMVYNLDGTLASHTDFSGDVRSLEYDANQRLIRGAYFDGSERTFTYMPNGQRATATDEHGTTTYAYDNRGRLTEKIDPNGYKLSYAYDAVGNRTSLTVRVGDEIFTTLYSYDALDRLVTVTDSQGQVTNLSYDANGNRSSLTLPNGITTTYIYDALNRLSELRSQTSIDELFQSYQYTLGPAGNRIRIDEHDGSSRHYTYDALHRLIQDRVTDSSETLIYQRDFTYDAVGNRLAQVIDEGDGPTTIASSYDSKDQLLNAGTTSYSWNANGNLTSRADDEAVYGWDTEDRLISVSLDDGTSVENAYDVDGNRVQARITAPGGQSVGIDYLIDDSGEMSHVVAEIVDGSVRTLYTRAGDCLISLYRPTSGTKRFYHFDGLGSVRSLSAETGTATDIYSYTAFGELLEHDGTDTNPYQFAGEPFDSNSGFNYNRARWLDTATGRFSAMDTFEGIATLPSTLNRYAYANNDPARMTDPLGLYSLPELGVVNAIRSTISQIQTSTGLDILVELDRDGDLTALIALVGLASFGIAVTGAVAGAVFRGVKRAFKSRIIRGISNLRGPISRRITRPQQRWLKKEFREIGGDPSKLRFNEGEATGYLDSKDIIFVRGDIYPGPHDHPRSKMGTRAVLAHELGHANYRHTGVLQGEWNDEFRAGYWAAKNAPSLTDVERSLLIQDALERAKEAGVAIRHNAFIRRMLSGQ
ncbi:MAG: hypothetical protein GY722_23060, partial [bacterium]|nr:hypothetical protein [bacterium]